MKSITILGGGIAGLTAAINLRSAGYAVKVFEKKQYCGKHTSDFQFLENWTKRQDVLDYLKTINIKTDFYHSPQHSVEFYSPSREKSIGSTGKTLMYLVKRGKEKKSIDASLQRQAERCGVRIIFNKTIPEHRADIVATGKNNPKMLATGYLFRLTHPDTSIILLDSKLSLKYYSYFICHNNHAKIVCVNPIKTKDVKERLDKTVAAFEKILKKRTKNKKRLFSATVSYATPKTAKKKRHSTWGKQRNFRTISQALACATRFSQDTWLQRASLKELSTTPYGKKNMKKNSTHQRG